MWAKLPSVEPPLIASRLVQYPVPKGVNVALDTVLALAKPDKAIMHTTANARVMMEAFLVFI
jgi:hypothetical protein